MDRVDFVLPWVDDSDPEWRRAKAKIDHCSGQDDSEARYRDWGCLRYWFRGVEKFAPWVNKVHLITWGHLPKWLNVNHPKLHIVTHQDYIPQTYLPTFSSHCIELNMHRIDGLSEHFVYFNDDTFLLQPLSVKRFFCKGLPIDCAAMNPISTKDLTRGGRRIFYIPFNDTQYLNREFDMRKCVAAHPLKWYAPCYGVHCLLNILLSPWPRFVGFWDFHLPQAFLKTSFEEAWLHDEEILDATCRNAIRSDADVNQWLIRYRQLAQGRFYPGRPLRHAVFHLEMENQEIYECILKQKLPMICINDSPEISEEGYERERKLLQNSFKQILPEASSYELYQEAGT